MSKTKMEVLKILGEKYGNKEHIRKLSIERRNQLTLSERIIKDKILVYWIKTDTGKGKMYLSIC